MSGSVSAATICLLACHGGPADHMAVFADHLIKQGYDVHIHANGPALEKFKAKNIQVKALNLNGKELDQAAKSIANSYKDAAVIFTDIADVFDEKVHQSFIENAPKVCRMALYDNMERQVKGGYSERVAKVVPLVQKVLFSNAHLATSTIYDDSNHPIKLDTNARVGVGYYPLSSGEKIKGLRKASHDKSHRELLEKHGLDPDKGQVLVYFGGNNAEYFDKAFPAFLSILQDSLKHTDLSQTLILIQQHPGAKNNNLDGKMVDKWITSQDASTPKIVMSTMSFDDVQIVAKAAMYYQTSASAMFALADIPTIQIGHETYADLLVKNGLTPSITSADTFIIELDHLKKQKFYDQALIKQALGVKDDYLNTIVKTMDEAISRRKSGDKSEPLSNQKKSMFSFLMSGILRIVQKIRELFTSIINHLRLIWS